MEFEKWQALGNDYVIVEQRQLPFTLTPARVRILCAAHTGIASDGVLLLSAPDDGGGEGAACSAKQHGASACEQDGGTVARLRIFNPDGSEAEVSGNGARQAVLYLRRHGWTARERFCIRTAAGLIAARIASPTSCTIALGRARLSSPDYPTGAADGLGELTAGGRRWRFQHVQVGNPQCAIRLESVDELLGLRLDEEGPRIESHELFPNRTNVSWYAPIAADRIRARIFERGVGETSASGTGASGAAVAHVLAGGCSPVAVELDGGELVVSVGEDLSVELTGWAVPVFAGRLSQELTEELHEAR